MAASSHLEFYNKVAACPVPAADCQVLRDAFSNVPRGYFTLASPGDPIDFMFVAQNPGKIPPQSIEIGMYPAGVDIAKAHLAFTHALFIEGKGERFHKVINTWMAAITGLPLKQAWGRCLYTNMVKCTTAKNALPCRMAIQNCSKQWFLDEVALWKPRIVVGMGVFAAGALKSLGIPCFAMLHPRHRKGKAAERQHLEALVASLAEHRNRTNGS